MREWEKEKEKEREREREREREEGVSETEEGVFNLYGTRAALAVMHGFVSQLIKERKF